jgi:hypothetical protein
LMRLLLPQAAGGSCWQGPRQHSSRMGSRCRRQCLQQQQQCQHHQQQLQRPQRTMGGCWAGQKAACRRCLLPKYLCCVIN